MRSIRVKFFFVVLIILGVRAQVKIGLVVVHLDLKGAPPKLDYLEKMLPVLQENGANALLIEYEDMFPYSGKLKNISSTHYDKQKLRHFLTIAGELGFLIIPLVQTFGHMEYVLKLQEFRHLREVPDYPDSICPAKSESQALIRHMIEQIMAFHMEFTTLRYLHVGCDGVGHLHQCDICTHKWSNGVKEFAEHIQFVADTVSKISSNTTTLIWDDMLRNMSAEKWNKLISFRNIQPVVWNYKPDILVSTPNITNFDLYKYHNKFNNIWIASAFKGADGKAASLPIIRDRFRNHFSWMNFIYNYIFRGERKVFEFSGIILTGWSRYSHMYPLCELLPVSVPLILNLQLIAKFRNTTFIDDGTCWVFYRALGFLR